MIQCTCPGCSGVIAAAIARVDIVAALIQAEKDNKDWDILAGFEKMNAAGEELDRAVAAYKAGNPVILQDSRDLLRRLQAFLAAGMRSEGVPPFKVYTESSIQKFLDEIETHLK